MTPETERREAGPALDAEIAEKVMGWARLKPGQMEPLSGYFDLDHHGIQVREEDANGNWMLRKFAPSSDIAAALPVLQHMSQPGCRLLITAHGCGTFDVEWQTRGDETWETLAEVVDADSLPLALCLAALSASSPEKRSLASESGSGRGTHE